MASRKAVLQDPRHAGAEPPFSAKQQEPPGEEAQLRPQADHGEKTYKGYGRMTGMATLITGADSGIGRAVALAFAREGADVLISYLNEDEDAQQTANLVQEAGRKAVLVAGDIKDEAHCQQLVDKAVTTFGKLDVLVNNAAFQMSQKNLEDITSEQFEKTFQTNVFAMFYLCKAAVPRMKPGASIINTSSIQAFDHSPQLLDYASSKSAIIGFTKGLARMLGDSGIRVNAVAPGPVWTPLIPSTMPAEKVKEFGKNTVFSRAAQPAELAPVYVLLASPEATYITGEVYGVTGGRMPF